MEKLKEAIAEHAKDTGEGRNPPGSGGPSPSVLLRVVHLTLQTK